MSGAVARVPARRRRSRDAGQSEAVRLFVDARPTPGAGFAVDQDNAAASRRFAAARRDPARDRAGRGRHRMMTPAEIAARLDERFRLLTGGQPHARSSATRRCGRRSTGPTTCSTTPSRACSTGSACSPAGSRSTPPRRSRGDGVERSTCSTASRNSSTSRSSSPRTTATRLGTACSRPSASTRSNGSTTRARPTSRAADTPNGAPTSSTGRRPVCADTTRFDGWPDRRERSKTSAPASRGRPRSTTPTSPCDRRAAQHDADGVPKEGYRLGPLAGVALVDPGRARPPVGAGVLAHARGRPSAPRPSSDQRERRAARRIRLIRERTLGTRARALGMRSS